MLRTWIVSLENWQVHGNEPSTFTLQGPSRNAGIVIDDRAIGMCLLSLS